MDERGIKRANRYIGLVSKHKDDAFELDAEVNLTDLREGFAQASENSNIARRISEEIWKATCYRFMLVNPSITVYH